MPKRRTRKLAAVAVGALVVGVGATYTLASWNDSEWVNGGLSGHPGIGTSEFEVQQNASAPFSAAAGFADHETNPGDDLAFSTGAVSLTPGDTVYAPVALRTTSTSIAGDVTLRGAVRAAEIAVDDAADALWDAIDVTVHTAAAAAPPSACAAGFDATGWSTIVTDAPLRTDASASQHLEAAAGSTQHYCFALTLPADASNDLQGRTIAPAWEFAAVSR